MDVFVIRHPEPDVHAGICYGQLDIAPKPGYETQIAEAAALLPANARVYSSPLQRCRAAAELLAQRSGLELFLEPRLMEMHFGDWEGVAWDDLKGPEVRAWMRDYVAVRTPRGESFQDLERRLTSFLKETLPRAAAEGFAPVLVTHAGIIRALHIRWSALNVREAFAVKVPFAELIRFSVKAGDTY